MDGFYVLSDPVNIQFLTERLVSSGWRTSISCGSPTTGLTELPAGFYKITEFAVVTSW